MKAETIARTVLLVVALVNQVLAIMGRERLPFAEDDVYQLVTLFFTVCTSAWAWWKNNSLTKEAVKADEYLELLKREAWKETE